MGYILHLTYLNVQEIKVFSYMYDAHFRILRAHLLISKYAFKWFQFNILNFQQCYCLHFCKSV